MPNKKVTYKAIEKTLSESAIKPNQADKLFSGLGFEAKACIHNAYKGGQIKRLDIDGDEEYVNLKEALTFFIQRSAEGFTNEE